MSTSVDRRPSRAVVEGTNQGSVAGVVGGLARLDARCLRLHRLPADHGADRQGVQRAADRGDRGLHHHAVAAAGRCDGVRLARRSGRAQDSADDLDPVVLDLQLHRRLLAHLRLPVLLPRAARHRHGRGMAGRRVACDGILAGALARLDERRPAGLLGTGLRCCRALAYGLLYDLIGWRGLLWIGILPALVVVWVRNYVKEPEVWLENRASSGKQNRGAPAAVRDLQARRAGQHADGLLVDGQRVLRLLLDLGAVRDATCRRTCTVRGCWWRRRCSGPTSSTFAASFLWGLVADAWGRRPAMIIPAIIAIWRSRRSICGPRILTWIISGFIGAGPVRRRDLRPESELSVRAIPDRGARDGGRLLSTTRARSGAAWSRRC